VKESEETKPSPQDAEMESQPALDDSEEAFSLPPDEGDVPEEPEYKPNDSDIPPLSSVDAASPTIDETPLEQDPEVLDTSTDVPTPDRDVSEPAEEAPADEQTDGSVMEVDGTTDAESPKEEEDDRIVSPPAPSPASSPSRRREGGSFLQLP
jgi:hypothetical protein